MANPAGPTAPQNFPPPLGERGWPKEGREGKEGNKEGTQGAQGTKQALKQQASGLLDDTRASAQSAIEGQKRAAAEGMGDFAGALRSAAQELEGKQKPGTARYARYAADSLERIAGSIKERDVSSLVGEVESFARAQPAVFLGAAVAAGFLAMRFLKASDSHDAGASSSAPSSTGTTSTEWRP